MSMADALLPGLPDELALLCFSKFPLHAIARCRAVSRSWATALLHYPAASRLPQPLACICVARVSASRRSSMAWLLFSRSDPHCRIIPFFNLTASHTERIHILSSHMQVVTTGTNLLLVRSRLTFAGDPEIGTGNPIQCPDPGHNQLGLLQAFDLWEMKWCKEAGNGMHVHPMLADRWGFATAHIEEHVYAAGGEGVSEAARSAERLNMKTGVWEMLPEMIKERSAHPAGFAMGGCFYVVGGEFQPTTDTVGVGLTQSGEFYDPEKGMWELVPGMWPEELWGFGEAPHVVVVNEEAYVIGEGSQVMRWRINEGWEKVGCLPDVREFEVLGRWFFHLVSVEKDELWVVLVNKDEKHPWLVFSCAPYQSNDGLVWELLPFAISFSPWKGIVASVGVYV